jgi:hypothetical protein
MRRETMKRTPAMILLAIALGGVLGSVLSYFLGGLFPDGPVRNFFFQRLDIGIPATAMKLGFITLTFGLSFAITTFTVLLIALFIWLAGRL